MRLIFIGVAGRKEACEVCFHTYRECEVPALRPDRQRGGKSGEKRETGR